jgi:multidrug efflux pump subunit AcrA (membrane-fusion protein)
MAKSISKSSKIISPIKLKLQGGYRGFLSFARRHPLGTFFTFLGFLLALIILGNLIRKPTAEPTSVTTPKAVSVYRIGGSPKITLQGQVEKASVVQVTSQTSGIVQKLPYSEGTQVYKGQTLAWLSTNYAGGNTLSVARQIAQVQNQNTNDSYQTQIDLINRQRDLANQGASNFEALRNITNQSIGDTQNLVNLNNDIISTLNSNLATLQLDPVTNASLILSTKQMISQFQSANLQLNSGLRNSQYQTNSDNPPTALANAQKDIALKQLDLQEKTLNMSRELSKLQLRLAQINEGLMYPSAPFAAIIQHVFVREGQSVNPGTPLFTLSAIIDPPLTVYVYAPKSVAEKISKLEPSVIHLGNKNLNLFPSFVSTEAVNGNLFAIAFTLPQENLSDTVDKEFVGVDLPIGYADSESIFPFVPLDAVYQTEDTASVFVEKSGIAQEKHVILGQIYGDFIQVDSGLEKGDQVILNRNVIMGDKVTVEN